MPINFNIIFIVQKTGILASFPKNYHNLINRVLGRNYIRYQKLGCMSKLGINLATLVPNYLN